MRRNRLVFSLDLPALEACNLIGALMLLQLWIFHKTRLKYRDYSFVTVPFAPFAWFFPIHTYTLITHLNTLGGSLQISAALSCFSLLSVCCSPFSSLKLCLSPDQIWWVLPWAEAYKLSSDSKLGNWGNYGALFICLLSLSDLCWLMSSVLSSIVLFLPTISYPVSY